MRLILSMGIALGVIVIMLLIVFAITSILTAVAEQIGLVNTFGLVFLAIVFLIFTRLAYEVLER